MKTILMLIVTSTIMVSCNNQSVEMRLTAARDSIKNLRSSEKFWKSEYEYVKSERDALEKDTALSRVYRLDEENRELRDELVVTKDNLQRINNLTSKTKYKLVQENYDLSKDLNSAYEEINELRNSNEYLNRPPFAKPYTIQPIGPVSAYNVQSSPVRY